MLNFFHILLQTSQANQIPNLDKAGDKLMENGVVGTLLFLAIVGLVVLLWNIKKFLEKRDTEMVAQITKLFEMQNAQAQDFKESVKSLAMDYRETAKSVANDFNVTMKENISTLAKTNTYLDRSNTVLDRLERKT